jgi:hypothetical protein
VDEPEKTERRFPLTDAQLYLAIGVPTFAVLLGILVNGGLYISLNTSLNARMSSIEARMLALESTFTARFDLLMGKLAEMDTRIGVLEDRSKR